MQRTVSVEVNSNDGHHYLTVEFACAIYISDSRMSKRVVHLVILRVNEKNLVVVSPPPSRRRASSRDRMQTIMLPFQDTFELCQS